ncbi:MAG: DUF5682 family protein [Candidatus Sumerlaeia bacterium]|nr:DUF5682 family protein [Candidatus Sumerlaeia bacterium]
MTTQAGSNNVHLFGIRHHGPGSARSMIHALESLQPDCVLIEGPEDANHLIGFVADPAMKPPVALLVYDPEEPRRCAFYPFAEFSPEWQAMSFALRHNIPVRFMDLPQRHQLALRIQQEKELAELIKAAEEKERSELDDEQKEIHGDTDAENSPTEYWHEDPLSHIAHAAGFEDTERWWEFFVEQRRNAGEVFQAIAEVMTTLRKEFPEGPDQQRESLREAFMRTTIRAAQKEGFTRIAVVCGAWHVPALATMPSAKDDANTLKGLPKIKVEATWAPWTFPRLAIASGYGAGVESPGWYSFLWQNSSCSADAARLSTLWLARVASLLREKDFDVSSAHLIEAVRLVEALCALRGLPLPGLRELNEAIVGVLLFGDALPLSLIHKKLVIGEALGEVPSGVPLVPLQQDLEHQQKSLRLKPAAVFKDYDLDLRSENDLARSHLLHRLRILGVNWGTCQGGGGRGTFRERWRLQWDPEMVVAVVSAAIHGNTVESAANSCIQKRILEARQLADLTTQLEVVLLAELPNALGALISRLEQMAAVASDVNQLLDAVPSLAQATRYGNVRGTDLKQLGEVLEALVVRGGIGLSAACASLDDDAASTMALRLSATDAAVILVENEELRQNWRKALATLLKSLNLHGNVAGRTCRLLFDGGDLDANAAGQYLGLALSRASDPMQAGLWVEGFLGGSGMVLLHSDVLWQLVDSWVCSLSEEQFIDVVPLLRRTFARFQTAERRMMGELVKREQQRGTQQPGSLSLDTTTESEYHKERGNSTLAIMELIFASGVKS